MILWLPFCLHTLRSLVNSKSYVPQLNPWFQISLSLKSKKLHYGLKFLSLRPMYNLLSQNLRLKSGNLAIQIIRVSSECRLCTKIFLGFLIPRRQLNAEGALTMMWLYQKFCPLYQYLLLQIINPFVLVLLKRRNLELSKFGFVPVTMFTL